MSTAHKFIVWDSKGKQTAYLKIWEDEHRPLVIWGGGGGVTRNLQG